MTHRGRVLTALRHEEPDCVPLFYRDEPEVDKRLQQDLGLGSREELLDYFNIDFRWVQPEYAGPPLCDEMTGRRRDIWGIEYEYVRFSKRAGYWQAASHPLADCEGPDGLSDYPWPSVDWFDFSGMKEQVKGYDEYAIMTAAGFSTPSVFQTPIQGLLGAEKSLIDIVVNPRLIRALVQRVLAFLLPFVDRMLDAAGGRIDFLRIGDDFGTQNGPLMGPNHWNTSIRPAMQAIGDSAKKHGAYYYLHSCGSVRQLIPHFLDIGVDVLDPVQVRAAGMIPAELKSGFGDKLCFCGGVDEQELLRTGSPDDVGKGVHQLLNDMARGGGFFLGPTHNFQDDIPTENIVAMYEAARKWEY